MRIFQNEIQISRRVKFECEESFKDGHFHMEYYDPNGDPEKKNLIEDLMNRTLDEASKIIGS